jgi:hypothetical protein
MCIFNPVERRNIRITVRLFRLLTGFDFSRKKMLLATRGPFSGTLESLSSQVKILFDASNLCIAEVSRQRISRHEAKSANI